MTVVLCCCCCCLMMVTVKKKSDFCRYLRRNFTSTTLGFILALIALELLVVCSYVYQEDSIVLNENLKSILYSLRFQYKKLTRISKQREHIRTRSLSKDWMNISSRGLVKDRQPAGDFVHYTEDEKMCGRETSTLFILIMSKFHEIDERNTVRQTWGSIKHLDTPSGKRNLKWRSIFVIANHPPAFERGKEIENELSTMNDTLRVDLMEHKFFANMKYYGALTWALNSCRFKYILTVEITSFINIPAMYRVIHSPLFIGRKRIYAGDRQSKLFLSPDNKMDKNKTNLSYAAKGAILMSRDLVHDIVPLLKKHNRLNYDSYEIMVGNAVSLLDITLRHMSDFLWSTPLCKYEGNRAVIEVTNIKNIQHCFKTLSKKNHG